MGRFLGRSALPPEFLVHCPMSSLSRACWMHNLLTEVWRTTISVFRATWHRRM